MQSCGHEFRAGGRTSYETTYRKHDIIHWQDTHHDVESPENGENHRREHKGSGEGTTLPLLPVEELVHGCRPVAGKGPHQHEQHQQSRQHASPAWPTTVSYLISPRVVLCHVMSSVN